MDFHWETITGVNLILSAVILALGLVGYGLSRKIASLYIGLAFGLFGFSHLATLMGKKDSWEYELVAVRSVGYLLVALALYRVVVAVKKEAAKPARSPARARPRKSG
ncbi:MAG: hypothetical protein ABSB96_09935 [Gaiellaceae bacterium]